MLTEALAAYHLIPLTSTVRMTALADASTLLALMFVIIWVRVYRHGHHLAVSRRCCRAISQVSMDASVCQQLFCGAKIDTNKCVDNPARRTPQLQGTRQHCTFRVISADVEQGVAGYARHGLGAQALLFGWFGVHSW